MRKTRIICPMYDISCPYCTKDGECAIENPLQDCDDFANMGTEIIYDCMLSGERTAFENKIN